MLETYGSLENVAIVTLAPEKDRALEVIQELTSRNITVSLGHSMSDLTQGNETNDSCKSDQHNWVVEVF